MSLVVSQLDLISVLTSLNAILMILDESASSMNKFHRRLAVFERILRPECVLTSPREPKWVLTRFEAATSFSAYSVWWSYVCFNEKMNLNRCQGSQDVGWITRQASRPLCRAECVFRTRLYSDYSPARIICAIFAFPQHESDFSKIFPNTGRQ